MGVVNQAVNNWHVYTMCGMVEGTGGAAVINAR